MRAVPRPTQSLLAGVMFAAAGGFALYLSQQLPVGTAFRMGPGYFPRLLAWLLMALGAGMMLRGLFAAAEPAERWHFRPLLLIAAALAAFALLLENAGLVVAILVTVLISRLADTRFEWWRTLVLIAVLVLASVATFVWGLGLNLPIWPA